MIQIFAGGNIVEFQHTWGDVLLHFADWFDRDDVCVRIGVETTPQGEPPWDAVVRLYHRVPPPQIIASCDGVRILL